MDERTFEVTLELKDGYRFRADFGEEGVAPLWMDEPPPLGEGLGPAASRVLAAAVGNCLSASALLCLRKARVDVHGMTTAVRVTVARNEAGRLRIAGMDVRLEPVVASEDVPRMRRCLEIFEDFCIVTQSVRRGVDVGVEVRPLVAKTAA